MYFTHNITATSIFWVSVEHLFSSLDGSVRPISHFPFIDHTERARAGFDIKRLPGPTFAYFCRSHNQKCVTSCQKDGIGKFANSFANPPAKSHKSSRNRLQLLSFSNTEVFCFFGYYFQLKNAILGVAVRASSDLLNCFAEVVCCSCCTCWCNSREKVSFPWAAWFGELGNDIYWLHKSGMPSSRLGNSFCNISQHPARSLPALCCNMPNHNGKHFWTLLAVSSIWIAIPLLGSLDEMMLTPLCKHWQLTFPVTLFARQNKSKNKIKRESTHSRVW